VEKEQEENGEESGKEEEEEDDEVVVEEEKTSVDQVKIQICCFEIVWYSTFIIRIRIQLRQ